MPAGAITLKNFVGKDRYLRFDLNAFADIERETGKSIAVVLGDEQRIGLDAIRLLFWAGTKWSDKRMDMETAGVVIERYIEEGGTLEGLVEKIMLAIQNSGLIENLSANDDEEEEIEGGGEDSPNVETPDAGERSGDEDAKPVKKSRKRSGIGSSK